MARKKARTFAGKKRREPFPWLGFALLVLSLALFWGLPQRLGTPPVRVEGIPPYAPDGAAPYRPDGDAVYMPDR